MSMTRKLSVSSLFAWKNQESEEHHRITSLSGNLWKMKRTQKVVVPQWNKRWCTIEGTYFRWYASSDAEACSGAIDLNVVESVRNYNSSIGGAYCFTIICPTRQMILRASSNCEREKWMRALVFQADLAQGGDGNGILSKGRKNKIKSKAKALSLEEELSNKLKELNDLEDEMKIPPDQLMKGNSTSGDHHGHVPVEKHINDFYQQAFALDDDDSDEDDDEGEEEEDDDDDDNTSTDNNSNRHNRDDHDSSSPSHTRTTSNTNTSTHSDDKSDEIRHATKHSKKDNEHKASTHDSITTSATTTTYQVVKEKQESKSSSSPIRFIPPTTTSSLTRTSINTTTTAVNDSDAMNISSPMNNNRKIRRDYDLHDSMEIDAQLPSIQNTTTHTGSRSTSSSGGVGQRYPPQAISKSNPTSRNISQDKLTADISDADHDNMDKSPPGMFRDSSMNLPLFDSDDEDIPEVDMVVKKQTQSRRIPRHSSRMSAEKSTWLLGATGEDQDTPNNLTGNQNTGIAGKKTHMPVVADLMHSRSPHEKSYENKNKSRNTDDTSAVWKKDTVPIDANVAWSPERKKSVNTWIG